MKKLLSFLLVMVISVMAIIVLVPPVKVEAAESEFEQKNVLQIWADSSDSYISGKWYSTSFDGTNIQDSGCGIVSLVSAVYNLGGTIEKAQLGDVINEVYYWAYYTGRWSGKGGTFESMFPASDDQYGGKYHFKVSGDQGKNLTNLIDHIKSGKGTAVVHVYAHYMVIVDYKEENGVEYLKVFDPAPGKIGSNRYYSVNRRNITNAAGDWIKVSDLQYDGGGAVDGSSSWENVEISNYWLVSATCSSFEGLGICTECNQPYPWKGTINTTTAGTYKVVKDFTPRTDAPYDDATKASVMVEAGDTVKVEASYTNAYKNTWYKFTYGNGKVGYVLAEYLELVEYNALNVTCTDFTPSENESLPVGQGYPVWGTVSSNYPLSKVVAKLDGSEYATWTASNDNTTSFAINPTDINNKLKFGSLSAGKHTVTLIATDVHGRTQTFLTRSFNMVSTSCSHSYGSSYKTDANNHWKVCSKCGSSASVEAHVYTNSCDTSCNTCGYTRSITHTYSNACDTSCNVCGATRVTSHEYDNACDSSCNLCGEERYTNHKYSNTCDDSCDVCGEIRTVPDHVYDHGCDSSCNNCGYSRPTNHSYDNNCDSDCNTCGAIRSVSHSYTSSYFSDDTTHWRQCSSCGHKGYIENHIPGTPATETNPQKCLACEYVIQPALGHTHSFVDTYYSDEYQHWHQCTDESCGVKTDIADHVFGQGEMTKEPTTTEKGEMTYICSVCGERKYEEIDIITGEDDNVDNGVEEKDHSKCLEEASGWKRFWNSIGNFFRRIFSDHVNCVCGDEVKKDAYTEFKNIFKQNRR